MIIKLLLLLALIALFYALVIKTKSLITYRLLLAALFVSACLAVLFPEYTTVIANFLGVGRGTDLIVYLSFMLFSYLGFLLVLRIRKLERQVTILTRSIAHLGVNRPVKKLNLEKSKPENGH